MNNKGFTLIELLVVISIIGVLSSVIFVSFQGSRDKARLAKAQNFDAQISHALGAYAVGIWRFEEGSGIALHDESGLGNNGTLGNGACTPGNGSCPSWAIGQGVYSGTNALTFDGNDYVEVSDSSSLDVTTAITIEAWVKATSTGTYQQIVGKYNTSPYYPYYYLDLNPSNYPIFRIGDDAANHPTVDTEIDVANNNWHHLVGVRDVSADKIYIYVDGIQKNSADDTTTGTIANDGNVTIGRLAGGGYPFNGTIDNVSIYNEALSSAQIQQHFVAGAPAHGIAVND